jgi:perosamine synthetase
MFKEFRTSLPVTEMVWKKIITLPLYPDLTDDQIGMIVETIRNFKPRSTGVR